MNLQELLLGVGLVVASVLALWPRDGQVRPFLRHDSVQAYYTVTAIGLFSFGVVNIITGLVP